MLAEIFKKPKPILATIRLLALPGSPGWQGHWQELTMRAEQEATALATGGVDGLIVENFHDAPYPVGRMDQAGAIAMAMLARRIKQFTDLPMGISVHRNDPETALAVAINTDADFIRVPLLKGALITPEGVINSRFNELLHYKAKLKAEMPFLLVDVTSRHLAGRIQVGDQDTVSHLLDVIGALPTDMPLAVVVSDEDLSPQDVGRLKGQAAFPVLVENQTDARQAQACFDAADGLVLAAGVRKQSASQPGRAAAVDMVRVEELVNPLKNIVPVTEMDPDIFLKR